MANELIIKVKDSEVQLAVLKDKKLVEFNKETTDSSYTVGDLYLAKVSRVMPNLNAAFVDVGYEKDAFLHYFDLGPQIRTMNKYVNEVINGKTKHSNLMYVKPEPDILKEGKITEVLRPGQKILVKIAKEPISQKGPRLSCEISIPGRYLVVAPFSDRISISSKIKEAGERERLKKLITPLVPKNFGVIVRTAAIGVKPEELERDINNQVERWEKAIESIRSGDTPNKVMGELKRSTAILRDLMNESFSFDSVYVNNQSLYEELKEFVEKTMPGKEKMIKLYDGKNDIFDHFHITKQIKAAFGKNVSLKSGGYLVIEHTEALHVIDVNSGNMSKRDNNQEENALDANMEAAEEIARQLRLRDMGGIIVIDFIDMHKSENKQKLFDFLRNEMRFDRAKHNILPPSKIGLVQITRERVRPVLDIETKEVCPTCNGSGKVEASILVIDNIENQLRYLMTETKETSVSIDCHPFIHAYLTKGLFSQEWKWKWKYKRRISVKPNMSNHLLEFKMKDAQGNEIII